MEPLGKNEMSMMFSFVSFSSVYPNERYQWSLAGVLGSVPVAFVRIEKRKNPLGGSTVVKDPP